MAYWNLLSKYGDFRKTFRPSLATFAHFLHKNSFHESYTRLLFLSPSDKTHKKIDD
jgi:hypothetical protein